MNIKKILIVIGFITYIVMSQNIAHAMSGDIFKVAQAYASNLSNAFDKQDVEIISDGEDYNEIFNNIVNEKYDLALKIKDEKDSNNQFQDNIDLDSDYIGGADGNGTANEGSYFAGTTDFTNLATSKKDALLNSWSAIRDSYASFDDGGEDNVTIIATAYTSAAEENGGWEGMNAIGGKLGPGCIAAPKDIPFHTKIRISGLGVFNVEDRGGAIVRVDNKTIRVDIWMNSYKEAMHFGKRVYKGRIIP